MVKWKLRHIGALSILASSCVGCASQSTHVDTARMFFKYQNVHLLNTYIGIETPEDMSSGQLTLGDIYIEGDVGLKNGRYFAASDALGFVFLSPVKGATRGERWGFKDCEFRVLEQESDTPFAQDYHNSLLLIEAQCNDISYDARFLYSPIRGLLSISLGELNAEGVFDLMYSFVLLDGEQGFGAIK